MSEEQPTPVKPNISQILRQKAVKITAICAAVVVLSFAGLVAVPVISPATGAQLADTLRSIVGPGPVADLESVSFQLQDLFNRTRYQVSGDQPQMTFADTPQVAEPTMPAVATRVPHPTKILENVAQATAGVPDITPTVSSSDQSQQSSPTSTPLPDVTADGPYIDGGWQPFGPVVGGRNVMARGSVKPDPTRPYAQAAVVRIDLSEVDLHFLLGTKEPTSAKGLPLVSRTGAIPMTDQVAGKLLVAFNGGFKAIHGKYGAMVNGTTVITPINGIATLAIYKDGSIDLGAWGRDINPSSDLIDFRQNCPLLLDGGQINPTVNDGSRKEWGYTVKNLDTTWRSGIGITSDGRYLVYAAGPSLTVGTLARALQMAGAYHAMQLDINGYYTRFAIYHDNPNPAKGQHAVAAEKLVNQMTVPMNQYLDPYDRDFFYITLHQG